MLVECRTIESSGPEETRRIIEKGGVTSYWHNVVRSDNRSFVLDLPPLPFGSRAHSGGICNRSCDYFSHLPHAGLADSRGFDIEVSSVTLALEIPIKW